MKKWRLLITSLPTENATVRMRVWRSLKACGAAVLRDGVYLLPELPSCRNTFTAIAEEVRAADGTVLVLQIEEPITENFTELFKRHAEFTALLTEIAKSHAELSADTAQDLLKRVRKLHKAFTSLVAIDFFPDAVQQQAAVALNELELAVLQVLEPDEPHTTTKPVAKLAIADYQNRTWATRSQPWADRLACAWLIRRFIDPQAQLLWLSSTHECPTDAIGFDFDGAVFSHFDERVTFEVLLASFDLQHTPLQRLGRLVHFLDVGGPPPAEAAGIESVLAGLRDTFNDDDQLLAAASTVFDSLLLTFEKGVTS